MCSQRCPSLNDAIALVGGSGLPRGRVSWNSLERPAQPMNRRRFLGLLGLAPLLPLGGQNTGLSLAKLIEARRLLEANDLYGEPIVEDVPYLSEFRFVRTALISQRVILDEPHYCWLVQTTTCSGGEKWDHLVPFEERPSRRDLSVPRGQVMRWCRKQGWLPIFA